MIDGRRQRGARARTHILDQAIALASTDGLEGLSLGRVAGQAGVAKGNIQVLFGDKETLQLATLDHAIGFYRRRVVEPAMAAPTPAARLTALVAGWYDYVERRDLPGGCLVNAVSSEYRARPGRIRDRINDLRADTRRRLGAEIREAQGAGEYRGDLDVDQLVFELTAFQAAANVAALMDDTADFTRARDSALRALRAATKEA